ncbi:MAG: DUF4404 family protein [Planctomycetales bacterium]|nr:DUF4404 family protein [Planctomycetales bacterium]
MEKEKLLAALAEIHRQLTDVEDIDDDVRQLLSTVTGDIDRVLDESVETSAEDSRGVTNRLNEMVARFEVEHPDLAALITRVSEGLANLGI